MNNNYSVVLWHIDHSGGYYAGSATLVWVEPAASGLFVFTNVCFRSVSIFYEPSVIGLLLDACHEVLGWQGPCTSELCPLAQMCVVVVKGTAVCWRPLGHVQAGLPVRSVAGCRKDPGCQNTTLYAFHGRVSAA